MHYKFLGQTGVKVSEICFGTMTFGGDADEKVSAELYAYCRDAGINFFDCANIYVGGRSEEILGALMQGHRDEVVIASKAYFSTGEDVNAGGLSRRHLRQSVEDSLRRLNTEYIDLFYMHRFDETVPLEESLRALDDMVTQGKILYLGASNFAAWQVQKALGVSLLHGFARVECIQPMYNLVKRQAEVELFPMVQAEGLSAFPYNPMGAGLLTGKYGVDKRPQSGRLVDNQIYGTRYNQDLMYQIADDFTALSVRQGVEPAALAVAWVGGHPAVTAPIIGARNLAQLKSSLKAVEIEMTPELWAEISALAPEPPPATDRSEERTDTTFGVRK
jgi:aryl-alcohol dehydrogenase-like predicted oxidoreductase